MTRVLYVEGNLDGTVGGSYHSLALLVEAIDRSQWEPVIVFYHDNIVAQRLRAADFEVKVLRFASRSSIQRPSTSSALFGSESWGRLAWLWRFWTLSIAPIPGNLRVLRAERIGLVHLNNSVHTNVSWMIAAWLAAVPCLTHQRGIQNSGRLAIRLFSKLLRFVICISDAVRRKLMQEGFPEEKLIHIANGIPVADIQAQEAPRNLLSTLEIPHGSRVIVMVGNFKAWKGQHVVVRALADITREVPNVVCVFVGDTAAASAPYAERVYREAEAMQVEGNVRFVGAQKNAIPYVAAAELLVHASIEPEPFGRVLIEAMALGKPVVATNGGGVPEIVLDGVTGILVPPDDSYSMASAVTHLLLHQEQARKFGLAGLARVKEHFDSRVTAKRVQALYRQLIRLPSRSR